MASSGRNRSGSLYRRWKGKEYTIDDKVAMGQGIIWLRYMLNGKRQKISLKTSDITEAKRKQQEFMAPLMFADEKEVIDQLVLKASQAQQKVDENWEHNNPPLTFEKAWDTYLISHERPDSGEATLANYKRQWKRFKKWHEKQYPGRIYLKDVTADIASEYASDLTKANLTPNTFNKHINLLKLFFSTLRNQARTEENPFSKIKPKKLKTVSKRELTKHELKTVLESADEDLKLLFYIGVFTGLRLGDCATLKWGEVDMDDHVIKRIPNKTRSRNAKPVIIGIPVALYTPLDKIQKSKRCGYVLPSIADDYQKDAPGLTNRIQKHFERCGIQVHKPGTGYEKVPDPTGKHKYLKVHTGKRAVVEVGFHSLRHTFVSLHATMGTAQAVIQAIVGHGNPAMTAHYTHIGKDAAKQAAGLLDSGIKDAEFEEVRTPLPSWARKLIEKQNSKNWKEIQAALLA